ncbi:MAG: DNA polymerase Y family protein [Myxococcota bacterium]
MRHRSGLVLFPGRQPLLEPASPPPEVSESELATRQTPAGGRGRASRVLVLHLPAFALERCGFEADQIAVCAAEVKSAMRLVALTPAARAAGLREGMTVSEARALEPSLLVQDHDPIGQDVDRQALLEAFAPFSDRVAPWFDQDLVLEVSGTAHLFGGESGVLERVCERAQDLGHECAASIADDALIAWALAAFGAGGVVPNAQGGPAVEGLPIAALRPSPELAVSLEVIGVRRIGTWAALDPASVAGRYGPEGVRLHRIACGQVASRLPWQPSEPSGVCERVVLGGPTITLEPVLFVLPGLLVRVAEALARQDAMAVRVAVHLVLERGPAHVVRVRVGRPTRDPQRLQKLIHARLERVRLEAPAVELMLEVEEETAEQGWQPGLLSRAEAAEDIDDLLARLTDALGEPMVINPVHADTWCPEHAWTGRAFHPGAPLPRPPQHRKAGDDPVAEQQHLEVPGPRPRPSLLLSSPHRVEVRARSSVPVQVRQEGAWRVVQRCEGPERIEGGWWREDGGWCRDYWVVQLEGCAGWCFVDEQRRWWWHGWFD